MSFAPSEELDQPGHPPSLMRVFAVSSTGSLGPKLSLCGQQRLWSDWVDAQADLSLRWAQMPFCWFSHEVAQMPFKLFKQNVHFSRIKFPKKLVLHWLLRIYHIATCLQEEIKENSLFFCIYHDFIFVFSVSPRRDFLWTYNIYW